MYIAKRVIQNVKLEPHPPLGTNYPALSFSLAYGFPAFGGADPSDGSSRTLYLNGMVSF